MSRHGWYRPQNGVSQDSTGRYGNNGPYASGGQPDDSTYGGDHGHVNNPIQAFRDDASSPTPQHLQYLCQHRQESEPQWLSDNHADTSANNEYYSLAETQNAVSHPCAVLERDDIRDDVYPQSMHSNSWSPSGTVRPTAGSFPNVSDNGFPHRHGGGKLRQIETTFWFHDDQYRRFKDEDIVGISAHLPGSPEPSHNSQARRFKSSKRHKNHRRHKKSNDHKPSKDHQYPQSIRQEDLYC